MARQHVPLLRGAAKLRSSGQPKAAVPPQIAYMRMGEDARHYTNLAARVETFLGCR